MCIKLLQKHIIWSWELSGLSVSVSGNLLKALARMFPHICEAAWISITSYTRSQNRTQNEVDHKIFFLQAAESISVL